MPPLEKGDPGTLDLQVSWGNRLWRPPGLPPGPQGSLTWVPQPQPDITPSLHSQGCQAGTYGTQGVGWGVI